MARTFKIHEQVDVGKLVDKVEEKIEALPKSTSVENNIDENVTLEEKE